MVVFILASAALVPAASAWEEQQRSVTQGRIYISGALAIATLPLSYFHQQAQNTTSGSSSAGRSADDMVPMFFMTAFWSSVVSLVASYVTLTLPDEMGATSFRDHWAYWMVRLGAILSLFAALFSTVLATSVFALTNPWIGHWAFIVAYCTISGMFIFAIIVWLIFGCRHYKANELPV